MYSQLLDANVDFLLLMDPIIFQLIVGNDGIYFANERLSFFEKIADKLAQPFCFPSNSTE